MENHLFAHMFLLPRSLFQMNMWKIIYLNCGEKYEFMIIIAVVHTASVVVKFKPEKKFRPERYSNPWPLLYLCSTLPTELSSHLGASHFVCSLYTQRRWRMQMNIWEIIYIWTAPVSQRAWVRVPFRPEFFQALISHKIYERSHIWTAEKDMNLWLIIAVEHTTYAVVKLKLEKNSGMNVIRTQDLGHAK